MPSSVRIVTSKNGDTECDKPRPPRIASAGLMGTRTGIVSIAVIFMNHNAEVNQMPIKVKAESAGGRLSLLAPGQIVFDEGRNISHNSVEEPLPLLSRSQIGVPHHAALGDLVKLVHEEYRPGE